MATLSWNVMLSLIMVSSVTYGFLTNVLEEGTREDNEAVHLYQRNEWKREVKERALEKLQEVFGLPDVGEKRHHQAPPQFMTELYNNIADQSGVSRRNNPYNAKVVRSFIERDNSLSQYFYFNISKLDSTESILEAQLHLYRMKTPTHELHRTVFTSPSLIIRVFQVLDEKQLGSPDTHRLLSSNLVGAHSHGWEVFNVKEAVLEWVAGRRPNKGLLVTTSTLFEQNMDVRFARRNEHHSTKQPILVLFNGQDSSSETTEPITYPHSGNPDYYLYHNEATNPRHSSAESQRSRRRRSLSTNASSSDISTAGNSSQNLDAIGECSRLELYINFAEIGWSSWIISPAGYYAYYCKGHCNFPLGPSQRPTNHATVQSIVHELNLVPGVEKPCCVPTDLVDVMLLFYDDNENVVLRMYEDMVADSCGCM